MIYLNEDKMGIIFIVIILLLFSKAKKYNFETEKIRVYQAINNFN
jgi:hypothetical protein